ncbi:MAG: GNAT family N-acetyltransferase [Acidimicrobiales bacterium]
MVRLAELMYRALGVTAEEGEWEAWRAAGLAALEAGSERLAVFVVDHPDEPGRLVACGAGIVSVRLPFPWRLDGRAGYVQWMSTEPDFRRRGLARAVLRALLAWFESIGVDNVELHASTDGAALYRSEGFWQGTHGIPMRRRPWDPPPDEPRP